MNWTIKIISKTLMTKISHVSWRVPTKGGYDKGFYGNYIYCFGWFHKFIEPFFWYGNYKWQYKFVLISRDLSLFSNWEPAKDTA